MGSGVKSRDKRGEMEGEASEWSGVKSRDKRGEMEGEASEYKV